MGGRRHALGLLAMVVFLFVGPVLLPSGADETLGGLLVLELVLISGVYSISGRRRALVTAVLLSAPGLAAHWAGALLGGDGLYVAGCLLVAAAIGYVVSVYLRRLLTAREVDAELLSASVSGYLLLGILWTALFEAMQRIEPSSIRGTTGAAGELGYFSFVALTTLGYGDIVPVASCARAAAALEAVAGQIYLAITIARLVGLTIATPPQGKAQG